MYVTDGEYNATLRKDDSLETLTPERAQELLAERRARGPAKKAAKRGAKKTTKKKSTAKKTAAKKTAAKKSRVAGWSPSFGRCRHATRRRSHRTATPLELFADLCYVVAVAQAALTLHHEIVEGHAGARARLLRDGVLRDLVGLAELRLVQLGLRPRRHPAPAADAAADLRLARARRRRAAHLRRRTSRSASSATSSCASAWC